MVFILKVINCNMRKATQIFCLLLTVGTTAGAQPYSLLIRDGWVVDPRKDTIDTVDIAIRDGRIAKIARHLDPGSARKVIDVHGDYVTPGLIGIHTHVYFGSDPERGYAGGRDGLVPDSFSFRSGVTTMVDAGSSGYRDFPDFRQKVILHSRTRVFAFINIVGAGMRGRRYEEDTAEMQAGPAAVMARRYPNDIVGFKVAHYHGGDWHPVDSAVQAGRITGLPVMIDFGSHFPPLSIAQLYKNHLRPGDIFTHCFAQLRGREAIVDTTVHQLKPFVKEAQQRGVCFDVGYGGISFAFSQALPALRSGFLPNSISSDIHVGAEHDILYIMSTFLAMGVDLPTVIRLTTVNPAREIHHPELGTLKPGAIADIAVLRLRSGRFIYADHTGRHITGSRKLECALTIRGGSVVYHSPTSRHRSEPSCKASARPSDAPHRGERKTIVKYRVMGNLQKADIRT
jgi:dihydroorotase